MHCEHSSFGFNVPLTRKVNDILNVNLFYNLKQIKYNITTKQKRTILKLNISA